jgi:hypothetical protein
LTERDAQVLIDSAWLAQIMRDPAPGGAISLIVRTLLIAGLGLALGATPPGVAFAGVITSPVSGVINSGGPGFGSLNDTFNQGGLSAGFTSGVTDFDAYLATNPTHSFIFPGQEWFSNQGTSSASVTYDMGAVVAISRLALWNEESSGIGRLDLFGSTDGITFSSLAANILPFDTVAAQYPAQVFAFAEADVRFIRFDMSACPQPDEGAGILFLGCGIGEVAFDVVPVTDDGTDDGGPVPMPASLLLLGLGLVALGARSLRKT